MSVTFSITHSPYHVSDTWECQCMDFDGPWSDCHCCQGTGQCELTEPSWPWVNMANTNAMNVQRAIGFTPQYDGCWEGETLDQAIKGCLRALNSDSKRAVAVREAHHIPGGYGGVRVVHEGNVARVERLGAAYVVGGYSDERVTERVRELLAICRKAKAEGESVVFG